MNTNTLLPKLKFLLMLGVGLVMVNGPVIAQQDSGATREVVTVTAPHVVRIKPAIGKQTSPIELISVDRRVSYHDLDLSKKSDADIFEKRINDAASDACKQLDKQYPPSIYIPTPANQDCVKTAVDAALVVAREIISASSK